ncbi:unnamed protein product [Effrenium voratum]|uniref:Alpha-(1,6)-fucosyltransferase N- and catalytic domain-containing protein n=1 Tax=Effrenium voratum TaxID=2562239 RepID=A0AA36N5G5_9DINO|nr:unnamed protein product [Effrenium voratum]CAJ1414338.1 unnamed protein product [Effrenium voratum]
MDRGRQGLRCLAFAAALCLAYIAGYLQGGALCPQLATWARSPQDLAETSAIPLAREEESVQSDDVAPVDDSPGTTQPPMPIDDKPMRSGKGCSQYEGVSFPLDGWPEEVRAKEGVSIYGTGWAQRRLREHQFPGSCAGKSFVEHGMFRSGIGSNFHISAAVLAMALNEGSIYLWPEDDTENPWTHGDKKSLVDCPGGKAVSSYQCYLKPPSSCKGSGGSRFTGVKRERGKLELKSTELIPRMFKELLKCSGYHSRYWVKWWRAQAVAFLLRPSDATREELAAFRRQSLVGTMQAGVLGSYVRHGDKYYEATEYPFQDYLQIFGWILGTAEVKRCAGSEALLAPFQWQLPKLRSVRRLYLGSDDANVLQEALSSFRNLIYMNVSRLSKRMSLMKVQRRLGPKQMVMESLLNLQLLMESDAFVCTWSSNWCRLVDEMRLTVGMKAEHLSLEVNKHCPRFNWVHGGGADTPDFR